MMVKRDSHIKSELVSRARQLGFMDARVCTVDIPVAEQERYMQWIAEGNHGEMGYMERLLEERTSGVEHVLPGAKSVIVLAASYFNQSGEESAAGATDGTFRIARYALGKDYHYVLRERLQRLVDWLDETLPGNTWRICVDSAPVMERTYAAKAGIGFVGKNGMIISWMGGSYTFLAEILTTAQIEPDEPRDGSCGNCTRCIDACPTQAIVAPGKLDARRCVSYLTIEKKSALTGDEVVMTGEWAFGCDICQDVCPYNKHPQEGEIVEFKPGVVVQGREKGETFLGPESNRAFERRFESSPILRMGKKKMQGLVRTKLDVLANKEPFE